MTVYETLTLTVSIVGAVISVVTLFIIVSNLGLQVDINQQQAKLLEISLDKDRRELMPVFHIESQERGTSLPKTENWYFTIGLYNHNSFTVIVKNHSAEEKGYGIFYAPIQEQYSFKVGDSKRFQLHIKGLENPDNPIDVIDLQSWDLQGRKYIQRISYKWGTFSITPPSLQEV